MAVGERIMKDLIQRLNEASEAYYSGEPEIMSNQEWDALYSRLVTLEARYGQLPDSPTNKVGTSWKENQSGNKIKHEFPALSLPKTKKVEDLKDWLGDKPGWISWKLDGLTLVLTYDDGKLTRIATRGNGYFGTDITFMKDSILGIPNRISYHGHLVVRGEAVINYSDFIRINEQTSIHYANPRNLAAGTLNLGPDNLDEVKERSIRFIAFALVEVDGGEYDRNSWGTRMTGLDCLGFETVQRQFVTSDTIDDVVGAFSKVSRHYEIPVDGLVLCFDDVRYANEGGITTHHLVRGGIAFKWADQSMITTLRRIEWSCGINYITPIAVFDPVELDGASVRRASLVNVNEIERLGIGEPGKTKIEVVRANMVIPKVVSVIQTNGITCDIPITCPACGKPTVIYVSPGGIKMLKCTNDDCPAKELKKFARFVGKAGLDIDGLAESTLTELISLGVLHKLTDIFRLKDHTDKIRNVSNINNILKSIEDSKNTTAEKFLVSLSIPNVGPDAARRLVNHYGWPGLVDALNRNEDFSMIRGVGGVRASSMYIWFCGENIDLFMELIDILNIEEVSPLGEGTCSGLKVAITGHIVLGRDKLKHMIEREGGMVTSTVSRNTDILITNDVESGSAKNKKAAEYGIQIIDEATFLELYLYG